MEGEWTGGKVNTDDGKRGVGGGEQEGAACWVTVEENAGSSENRALRPFYRASRQLGSRHHIFCSPPPSFLPPPRGVRFGR